MMHSSREGTVLSTQLQSTIAGDTGSKKTTGNSGSAGPAGRTMFGLSFPGFQPTEPSRI